MYDAVNTINAIKGFSPEYNVLNKIMPLIKAIKIAARDPVGSLRN